ncbi:hypothetical protein NDU88_009720 [Pleurodeles waltl]|uniref:Uncharacterized protein n=1 Tax=Pleurodeles waltl TaxID=8319 RepID=A0AAV7QVV8_PLEWA|nr:hypothetical protein NDU88_009720 [Pleurodeles waltl]
MAPKATRNPGNKTEGVEATRVGRDKGELAGVNKRLTSIAGKPAGKNMLSLWKDAKMSDSTTTPPLEIKSGEGAASISRPATEGENLHKSSASPKRWGKITGKDPQFVDWGKDNSDKFYSLTEESDLSSGDHSFGGSDDSETSEAENISSSNEPTVRQLRRQRKSVKSRPCSQEGLENSTSTGGRTLK